MPKQTSGRTAKAKPDYVMEMDLRKGGALRVAGVDEVGRGPLAGPVVACAVILDSRRVPEGLNDSKKLSAKVRDRLHDEIMETALVSVAFVTAEEIDRINIRQATLKAMTMAVAGLAKDPCHVLVDGSDLPPAFRGKGTVVVKGDSVSQSIAAASIVAKVVRDREMAKACETWPAYGFSRHAGYGTPEHLAALQAHGPCPIHRMSFAPLRTPGFAF